MSAVHVKASGAGFGTLEKLSEIVALRMKYMNETARGAVAACALNVLASIRSATRVAKPSGAKVKVKRNSSLYFSYSTRGSAHVPCLRVRGSGARYAGQEKMVLAQAPEKGADKTWQVYEFEDEYSKTYAKYLIPAPSQSAAKQKAKQIVRKRIARYAGLAKRAVGALMKKAFNTGAAEAVAPLVARKADDVTHKFETVSKNANSEGGTYSLTLMDNLNYALDALRGGRATVDAQMKKAMNKIVSVINRKLPDGGAFFGAKKLETPFPELARKRK